MTFTAVGWKPAILSGSILVVVSTAKRLIVKAAVLRI